ncbi:MAG: S8 family peptidase [Bacteroidota bacterium]
MQKLEIFLLRNKNITKSYVCFLLIVATFIVARSQDVDPALLRIDAKNERTSAYFILKSSRHELNDLRKRGEVSFAKEIAPNHYVVTADFAKKYDGKFQIVGPASAEWKLSPQWKTNVRANTSCFAISTRDLKAFKQFLDDESIVYQIQDEHQASNQLIVKLRNTRDLDKVIQHDQVTFINPLKRTAVEESPNSFQDISVNKVNKVHEAFSTIDGSGLHVSVKEKSVDLSDIDLRGRIVSSPLADEQVSLHANLIATIIAGAGNTTPSSKGVAWQSTMSSSSFSRLLPDDNSILKSQNVSVQNHSYGTAIENFYGPEASAYDVNVMGEPDILHVFSSGNAGSETASTGIYKGLAGFANMTGEMKMAKNVLVVNAHYQDHSIDIRNSNGPAYDGRLCPELTAFGPEGTSDGAAMVSGVALLMQGAYKQLHGSLPRVDLLKAALVATAEDIALPGIDFKSGYGAVNAYRAVQLINANWFAASTVQEGQQHVIPVNIPAGVRSFKVALNWIDQFANAGDMKALVNDLDLTVKEVSSGDQWLPWVLRHYPHIDSLSAPARRRPDHLNNTELVTIETPEAGTYNVTVSGFDLATTNQSFYVAYWLDTADVFQWTFPTQLDPVEANKEIYFRWENGIEGIGSLEVSLNGGPFELISDEVPLTQEFFSWTTPDTSGTAMIRMKIGNDYFMSDVFTISPSPRIKIGFNCDESFMLNWNKIPGAEAYRILNLGDKYLEVIATQPDTVKVLSKGPGLSRIFAIEPVISGKPALRSAGYDYEVQGVNCYYKAFLAEATDAGDARLNLSLSIIHNVDKIIFEKRIDGIFTTLAEIDNVNVLENEFIDEMLAGGITVYRATVVLQTGEMIQTNTATLYYGEESTYLVFPNPARLGEELSTITGGEGLTLFFYDATGRVVKGQEIFNGYFSFPLAGLSKGLYLYRFFRDSKPVASGKLFVN